MANRNCAATIDRVGDVEALEPRVLFSVYTVTLPADNLSSPTPGTLRWAIVQANAHVGVDTIAFNLPAGQRVVQPLGELPVLTDPTVLDATTQPGFAGKPLVQLDGSLAGKASGLKMYGGSTIKGLAITNFAYSGIDLYYKAGMSGNVIRGNWIGLDLAGNAAGNGANSIYVNSPNNVIGGPDTADRNVISASRTANGIWIQTANATGNLVQGNYIGTDPTGTAARPNFHNGVGVQHAPANRIVGNVIAGNNDDGVILMGTGGSNNVVQGNLVGLAAGGSTALPNKMYGMEIQTDHNTIGGTLGSQRNVVSGNGIAGIVLYTAGSTANQIVGNYVGTDVTGNLARGNAQQGIAITGASGNFVTGNLISGNVKEGVGIFPGYNTTVQGNTIGFAANGSKLVNGTWAVTLVAGASGNVVGGAGAGQANYIADHPQNPDVANNGANTVVGNLSTPPVTQPIPGALSLSSATYSAAENAGSITITVTRTAGTTVAASVNYATANGSALSGSDYTAATGTLTFAAGQTSKTIVIPLLNDATPETAETFTLSLSSPTAAATVTGVATSTITITNDDVAVPGTFALASAAYKAGEASGSVTVTVTRTAGTNVAAAINYATTGGSATAGADYTPASGTLTFAAGETSKTFSVALINDTAAEPDETVSLVLSSPSNGVTLGASVATLTIVSDDPAAAASAPSLAGVALAQPGGSALAFSLDPGALAGVDPAAADFFVTDANTGATYTPASVTFDGATNTVGMIFGSALPAGTYTARLFGNGGTAGLVYGAFQVTAAAPVAPAAASPSPTQVNSPAAPAPSVASPAPRVFAAAPPALAPVGGLSPLASVWMGETDRSRSIFSR